MIGRAGKDEPTEVTGRQSEVRSLAGGGKVKKDPTILAKVQAAQQRFKPFFFQVGCCRSLRKPGSNA